jgi:hypothetical protein
MLGSNVLRNFLESFLLFVAVVLAVSSPSMSMTQTFSPTFRTSIVTCAWGMSVLLVRLISLILSYRAETRASQAECLRLFYRDPSGDRHPAQGALLIRVDTHKVREAGDVEDLDVVVAETVGQELTL